MKLLRFLSPFLLALALAGCGGGGGNSNAPATSTKLIASIDWAARTRSLNAPSSAQSVVISINGATPDGGDFRFTINRDSAPDAYSKSYTSLGSVMLGNWTVKAMFYGENDGSGDIVGVAGAKADIKGDGTGLPTLATVGTFKTVSIPAGQTVTLGQSQDLAIMAGTANASGAIVKEVAISPGSITWKINDGSDKLTFANGEAKGMVPGMATVTATVDGIVSAPQTVTVISTATIAISPTTVTLKPGVSQPFSVALANAPDNSVTWTTQLVDTTPIASDFPSNPPPGFVTQSGVYTAPMAVGIYKVTVTSKFDPGKKASALVTVESLVKTISLRTNDMVYSPVTDRLYASASVTVGGKSNGIAIINPTTAVVEATIPTSAEPHKLALADDGKTLYVALDSLKSVVRFDIPTTTLGTPFIVNPTASGGHIYDMKVAPGHPELLALVSGSGNEFEHFDDFDTVNILKDGVALPNSLIVPGSRSIAWGVDSSRLYASGFKYTRLNVASNGLSVVGDPSPNRLSSTAIWSANGHLYTLAGLVFDPENAVQIGDLKPTGVAGTTGVVVDSNINLAFGKGEVTAKTVDPNIGRSSGVISLFNLKDYSLTSSFDFGYLYNKYGNFSFTDADIMFSGGKSIAVRDSFNIYILGSTPGL